MNIIITGAGGTLGSLLRTMLPGLLNRTFKFTAIDAVAEVSSGSIMQQGASNFIVGDLLKSNLDELISCNDIVIHLAAFTNVGESFCRADEIKQKNHTMTVRVVDACKRAGARLIFPSTTSVYKAFDGNIVESGMELDPQSPYAESKLESELMIQEAVTSGLKAVIVRMGSFFGVSPGMKFHTAINRFCLQAVSDKKVIVWRTAHDQLRPYLGIYDAVRAFAFIINKDLFNGEIYDLATVNLTVRELVQKIKKIEPSLYVDSVESRSMNTYSYGVASRSFKKLGFVFEDDIDRALLETMKYIASKRITL